jgi:hypothetical protein
MSENSLCVILCGSAEVTFRKNEMAAVFLQVLSSSLSQSREKLLGVLEYADFHSEALDK